LNVPYPLTPAARGRANTSSGRIVLARMEHAVAAVVGGIVRRRTMFHVKHIGNGRKACLACHLSRGRLITPYPTRLAAVCDDGGLAGTTKPEDEAERQPSPLPSRQCSKGADMLLAPNRSASAHLGPIRQPSNPSPRRRRPWHGGCCSSAAPSRPRSARPATSVRSDHPDGRSGISCPQARPTHRREKR
jgi:hypothetical protein